MRWIETLATGFYLGKAPKAPGTFGTLLGIPIAWLLLQTTPVFYMIAAVVLLLFASYVAEMHERATGGHDPSEVVIDEVVGYVIAMTFMPATWQAFVGAFLLFRFFDILKPPPIGMIDRKVHGGLGTVLDDVAAGVVANLILQVVYTRTDWLGGRLVLS